jgi:hypothetical protein
VAWHHARTHNTILLLDMHALTIRENNLENVLDLDRKCRIIECRERETRPEPYLRGRKMKTTKELKTIARKLDRMGISAFELDGNLYVAARDHRNRFVANGLTLDQIIKLAK